MVILFVLLQAPYRIVAQSWPGTMTQCRQVGTVGKRKITGTTEGILQWVGGGGGGGGNYGYIMSMVVHFTDHYNVAMDIAAMKRQITQMASDLQKLKASKMKMAMEIANRKVTAFVLHLRHHMIFVQLKPWNQATANYFNLYCIAS